MPASGVLAATFVKRGQYELHASPLPEPSHDAVVDRIEMRGIYARDGHIFYSRKECRVNSPLVFSIAPIHESYGVTTVIDQHGNFAEPEELPLPAEKRKA